MPRVLTKAEREFLTRPHERSLWGQPHTVTPVLVSEVLGDGEKLLILTPIMTRPNYYIVQIDSSWDLDGEEFRDQLEEVYGAIELEFGSDDEDEEAPWPALSGGGCTWGEIENLAAEMAAGRDVPTKRPALRAKRTAKARRSARKGPLGRGR